MGGIDCGSASLHEIVPRLANLRTTFAWILGCLAIVSIKSSTAQATDSPPSIPPILRKDTVVFELTKPLEVPPNFNWFFQGPRQADDQTPARREDGAHQAMLEPLFLLNYSTGKLDPWLGDTLTADAAHKVWTLRLRKDVTWSDGTPFNADDVIFTVNVAKAPRLNLAGETMEAGIIRREVQKAEYPDPPDAENLTVVFTLNEPNPRFALENFGSTMFGSFLIVQKHAWEDILDAAKVDDPAAFAPKPIGTGPYVFKEVTSERVVWKLNKDWWGAKTHLKPLPRPQQLAWQFVGSPGMSKEMLQARDNGLDAARPYSRADFESAKHANGKIVGWDASGPRAWSDPCARQLDVNVAHRVGAPPQPGPWTNPALRKALSLLIDRTVLARKAYGDTTVPSRTIFPEYGAMQRFINPVVAAGYGVAPTADPAGAAAAFTAAGYAQDSHGSLMKDSKPLAATILVDRSMETDMAGADEVASQMRAAGIDAKVEKMAHDDYWGRAVPHGEYEMTYGWLSCGSVAEPYSSMVRSTLLPRNPPPAAYEPQDAVPVGQRSPGVDNTGRWGTKAAKDFSRVVRIDMAALAPDDTNLPARTVEAYKFLAEEMPVIPLVQSPMIIPFNTHYWNGWPKRGDDAIPMHAWEQTQRLIHQLKPSP